WEELEAAGFIESFVGRGCFIAPMSADKLQRLKRAMAADKLSDAAAYCQGMGLSLAEAEGLLGEAWRSAKE
ncbi:MAG: GntR family transcriptional regulator, partial [Clostridia bacterium]|nr:GntR family transcriptional regulator [Clostridia bacterium]